MSDEQLFHALLAAAGCGKTYYISQRLKEDNTFGYRTATSGVAAINMSATINGNTATTINSALGYFDTASLLHKVANGNINKNLANIAKTYKYLIIDEISMLEAAQVDLICLAITEFNKKYNKNLGLLVVGDPGQLPAVKGQPFFTAKAWDKFKITYLTEVKRQKDKDFINALQLLRKGKAEECVDWFVENIPFEKTMDNDFQGSTFFGTNAEVDKYNFTALAKIPEKSIIFPATILGTAHSSWKDIPSHVELKRGALVQILVNNLEDGYANGDMGFIEELYNNKVLVRLLRSGRCIYIPYTTNKNVPIGSFKSIGSISRMPLRLAYSISCHKAQGLTLDAAQFNLKGSMIQRTSGMLYVMFSRVRTKEGIRVIGTKDDFIRSCFVDKRYLKWIN